MQHALASWEERFWKGGKCFYFSTTCAHACVCMYVCAQACASLCYICVNVCIEIGRQSDVFPSHSAFLLWERASLNWELTGGSTDSPFSPQPQCWHMEPPLDLYGLAGDLNSGAYISRTVFLHTEPSPSPLIWCFPWHRSPLVLNKRSSGFALRGPLLTTRPPLGPATTRSNKVSRLHGSGILYHNLQTEAYTFLKFTFVLEDSDEQLFNNNFHGPKNLQFIVVRNGVLKDLNGVLKGSKVKWDDGIKAKLSMSIKGCQMQT